MNYIHLTIEERLCISKFKEMKMSISEMTKILKRNPSSISRELKRNSYKNQLIILLPLILQLLLIKNIKKEELNDIDMLNIMIFY